MSEARRTPVKSIIVEARMHRNHKVAALPNDAARWAYLVVLLEAKWQKPEGQFRSEVHLRACIGSAARWVDAMKSAGLLDFPADGTIVVHDWDDYQMENSSARVREWRANKRSLRAVP